MPKQSLIIVAFLLLNSCWLNVSAQQDLERLNETILAKDAAFWRAYNKCDISAFGPMFTDDVEFFHDKGGPTIGHENFMNALKNGLCGDPNSHLRRVAVERTVQVFPLENGKVIYGAIISGEHVFYVNQKGKPEFLDGRARFLQLWLLNEGVWKMARILSYDHGPASKKGGTK
ncbi:MAG TPA: nuclear transport factor 2 family protein [Pyrinomonadaceae bacterium]|nr:nuclear transport factor 2 family protein [Pyrinomonadaceae bacterium]